MQNRKPMVLVFAGPNGSGKSTITSFFDKVGRYTNADDIVMSTGMANIDAAILVDKMRYESIEKMKILHSRQFYHQNIKWIYLERLRKRGILLSAYLC